MRSPLAAWLREMKLFYAAALLLSALATGAEAAPLYLKCRDIRYPNGSDMPIALNIEERSVSIIAIGPYTRTRIEGFNDAVIYASIYDFAPNQIISFYLNRISGEFSLATYEPNTPNRPIQVISGSCGVTYRRF